MKLGEVLRRWRIMNERDLRSVGKEIGISAPTLMRLEQGRVPDGVTLAKVLAWLLATENNSTRIDERSERPLADGKP